jgi:hypothetical protein
MRVERKKQRGLWTLVEVEVVDEVAEDGYALADGGA